MSKDEYLITDAPLKALTVFAMPMILGSFFPLHLRLSVHARHSQMYLFVWHLVPVSVQAYW